MKSILQWLAEHLGPMLRSMVDVILGWLVNLFVYIRAAGDGMVAWVLSQGHSLMPSLNWGAYADRLAQVNYFFPLSECLAFAVLLWAAWGTMKLYRLIKSWVPTVSS